MTTDLTPEHTARHPDSDSYSEVIAAYQYVQSVIPTADVQSSDGGYAWHGWALREAFLAGCTHARAALADEPAAGEPASVTGQPSDEAWDALVERAWDKYQTVGYQGERFMHESDFDNALEFVRQGLARWGNPAPQPPADGEVAESAAWLRRLAAASWICDVIHDKLLNAADLLERRQAVPVSIGKVATSSVGETVELVPWLLEEAEQAANSDASYSAGMLTWAAQVVGEHADLLERQATPVPVPVSERLPGSGDCVPHPRTKTGNWCWGFERCEVSLARPARWRLMHMETVEMEASHWLPAHALPVPGLEVEG